MTDAHRSRTRSQRPSPRSVLLMAAVIVLGACTSDPTETAVPSASPAATATPAAPASAPVTPSASAEPSPTPEPTLSIDLPDERDARAVAASVTPSLDAVGGELLVSVTSLADTRVDELVVRWPAPLNATLMLAPFVPSDERIRDGGPPLVQPWTKWVVGPGERGEPAGTISLGYGPLLPGATLEVRLFATRVTDGPIAFDLQLLAGNDLLALEGGAPAELRVEIP